MPGHLVILHDASTPTPEGRRVLRDKLRKQFQVNDDTLDAIFVELPVILKQDLSQEDAMRFATLLERVGAITEVLNEGIRPLMEESESVAAGLRYVDVGDVGAVTDASLSSSKPEPAAGGMADLKLEDLTSQLDDLLFDEEATDSPAHKAFELTNEAAPPESGWDLNFSLDGEKAQPAKVVEPPPATIAELEDLDYSDLLAELEAQMTPEPELNTAPSAAPAGAAGGVSIDDLIAFDLEDPSSSAPLQSASEHSPEPGIISFDLESPELPPPPPEQTALAPSGISFDEQPVSDLPPPIPAFASHPSLAEAEVEDAGSAAEEALEADEEDEEEENGDEEDEDGESNEHHLPARLSEGELAIPADFTLHPVRPRSRSKVVVGVAAVASAIVIGAAAFIMIPTSRNPDKSIGGDLVSRLLREQSEILRPMDNNVVVHLSRLRGKIHGDDVQGNFQALIGNGDVYRVEVELSFPEAPRLTNEQLASGAQRIWLRKLRIEPYMLEPASDESAPGELKTTRLFGKARAYVEIDGVPTRQMATTALEARHDTVNNQITLAWCSVLGYDQAEAAEACLKPGSTIERRDGLVRLAFARTLTIDVTQQQEGSASSTPNAETKDSSQQPTARDNAFRLPTPRSN